MIAKTFQKAQRNSHRQCVSKMSFLRQVAQTVKASTCNARDLGSIPGSGRSPGEGNGNPLQYSCHGEFHG